MKNYINITPQINWTCSIVSPDGLHDYTIPATVPGCVHTDLLSAGIITDPFLRKEADKVQWIEECEVVYSGAFHCGEIQNDVNLLFYGLDCYARIELNGHILGECDNMFIRHSFSAAQYLRAGENELKIYFDSPVQHVKDLPPRPAAFTAERLYTRRIQCTYGWDWVARFVTMGIWRPVELVQITPNQLTDAMHGTRNEGIYIYTRNINPFGAQIGLELSFQHVDGEGWVEMSIVCPDGKTIAWKKKRKILTTTEKNSAKVCEIADITKPELWYPAGYGEQPLYQLECKVYNAKGILTDERVETFGIRTVEIIETEDPSNSDWANLAKKVKTYAHLDYWDHNEGSSRFCLLVNGIEIFCQGADWVPCEPFPSNESPEKIEKLVWLAKEAGVNMLRVWGGGIFENDSFYSACDRMGILVTQDFLMACGAYPEEDPAFLQQLKKETETAALALRNHASLVWWSGDNENAVEGNENMEEYRGRRAALCAIGPTLEIFDPYRRFLPSSPYGGVPYASAVRGTAHNTQFLGTLFKWVCLAEENGDWRDYREQFDKYLDRFTAEQPALGMPFVSSLQKFMTDEDIFGEDTSVSEYHTKNNPGLGKITIYGYIDRMARGIFGEYSSGEDRISKMQLLQCEWVRLSMELYRRNAWYASGILYWMWNDCWPAANGWSLVDYYAMPKPAYYAFMRCAKPLIASIVPNEDGRTRVYISYNGKGERAHGQIRLYSYNLQTGEEREETIAAINQAAGETKCVIDVAAVSMTKEMVLLADVSSDIGDDRAFALPFMHCYADMPLDAGKVAVITEDEDCITIRAERATPFAMVDYDGYVFTGAGEFMKKGEIRQLNKRKI